VLEENSSPQELCSLVTQYQIYSREHFERIVDDKGKELCHVVDWKKMQGEPVKVLIEREG
jgi:hypothetical protein